MLRDRRRGGASPDPQEAAHGLNSNVIPVEEVKVGTAPDNSGAILHLLTADEIPLAVELPISVLKEVVEQAQHVLEQAGGGPSRGKRLH